MVQQLEARLDLYRFVEAGVCSIRGTYDTQIHCGCGSGKANLVQHVKVTRHTWGLYNVFR